MSAWPRRFAGVSPTLARSATSARRIHCSVHHGAFHAACMPAHAHTHTHARTHTHTLVHTRARPRAIGARARWHTTDPAGTTNPDVLTVINPCTEEIVASVPVTPISEVPAIVRACVCAHTHTRAKIGKAPEHHARAVRYFLERVEKGLRDAKDELVRLECLHTGKPAREALSDVLECVHVCAYVRKCQLYPFSVRPIARRDKRYLYHTVEYRRVPVGVVAAISPWNYPLMTSVWKVASALAAGCSVILKPSEYTPLSARLLESIIHSAADTCFLPRDLFRVVYGRGDLGAALAAAEGVSHVTFTGSTRTGVSVAKATAEHMKRSVLELGGKSPAIVLPDANLDTAIEWLAYGSFVNAGQVCSATSRVLVHSSIADEVQKRLVDFTRRIRIGMPHVDGTEMGPITNAVQYRRVQELVESARVAGADILCGGGRPAGETFTRGYWYEPTIIGGVRPDMRIWREEVFGPVMTLTRFSTVEEAVALANDTEYGLAASVFGGSPEQFQSLSQQLNVGMAWHNCSQPTPTIQAWGGTRMSGIGRLLGPDPLQPFMEVQSLTLVPESGVSAASCGWYNWPTGDCD